MNKVATIVLLGIAVAAGVFVGTLYQGEKPLPTEPTPPAANPDDAADETQRLRDELERTEAELDAARERTVRAAEEAAAAQAELAAVETPADGDPDEAVAVQAPADDATDPKAPRLTFEKYDETLRKVDWEQVGGNLSQMTPLLAELITSLRAGEAPNPESLGRIQQLNGPLVTAALQLGDGLPGTGVNGRFTHPVFQANVIASALAAAEKPLTESQQSALEALGTRYAEKDEWRTQAYDDRSFKLKEVLDEADLKDAFFAEAFALLTAEQSEAIRPAATHGLIGMDLFSSGLLLAQILAPLPAGDTETLASQMTSRILGATGLPEERRPELAPLVTDWANALPAEWKEPSSGGILGRPMWSADFVKRCGQCQLDLQKRIVNELTPSEAVVESVTNARGITLPMVR